LVGGASHSDSIRPRDGITRPMQSRGFYCPLLGTGDSALTDVDMAGSENDGVVGITSSGVVSVTLTDGMAETVSSTGAGAAPTEVAEGLGTGVRDGRDGRNDPVGAPFWYSIGGPSPPAPCSAGALEYSPDPEPRDSPCR
jgi:hypothetical protein